MNPGLEAEVELRNKKNESELRIVKFIRIVSVSIELRFSKKASFSSKSKSFVFGTEIQPRRKQLRAAKAMLDLAS